MRAAKYDLYIEQGASFSRRITLTAEGKPLDLTGYKGQSHIREKAESKNILAEIKVSVVDAKKGVVEMSIPSKETAVLSIKKAVYDMYLGKDGEAMRILEGDVAISPSVTR